MAKPKKVAQPRLKQDGTMTEPHITWDKKKCFALALAVDHQKQECQSDKKWCNHWKSILAVVNTVYLQEFPDFRNVYPNGLPNPNKLRTEYSDRYRIRESAKWKTKESDCSDEEIVELERIAEVVLQVETDLCNAGVQKVRDHRAEALKVDGVPATRWPSDNEIRKAPVKKSTVTGEKPVSKTKKSASKSKKRKYESDYEEEEDEELKEEQEVQNEDSEENTPASTARPTHKRRAAPIERMARPLRTSKVASNVESDAEHDDSANDESDASIVHPTISRKTVVGERSYGPDQNNFQFNYEDNHGDNDEDTNMPDSNVVNEDNESDEENNDYEHGKYDAAYARLTTGNKTVVSERSSGSRHSYDPIYGSDVQCDDNESNDGQSVNGDDNDDANAEITVTDKGHAEMRRAMLLGGTAARPTAAPGAAGGDIMHALLHGYADSPHPPVFAPRANTTAAGKNATGNTIDLTNTIAAGNDAARETIDLTNNQRSTKKVRFDKDAARDAPVDLTNDQPKPKMAPSLPSENTNGYTDEDLAFSDPFGLNEHEQTYAHVDAVQNLDPNLLPLDQVPGICPQQSRPQQSRPQQSRPQQSRHSNKLIDPNGDLPTYTNGTWDGVVMFGPRPTTADKTVVGERSNGSRHTYGVNSGSDSNDHVGNEAEDNVPSYDNQVSMYMQRDAGWQPHNAAIAVKVQKYAASFGLTTQHDTTPTEPVAVTFPSVKRTLITAMQVRRWDQVLGVILKIPGVDGSKWSHERDLINPLALSICIKYEDVAEAVFQATNSMSTSSFGLQILLAAPTGTLPTRGTNADIEHLNTILNGIHARVEMSMIHTKDVDFTALVPTCFVRFTSEPLVTVGCQLYSHGREVRRVLLQDDLTGQTYEVDLMLCDPKFCRNCGATADACAPISFNDSARQALEHPRVHHKDVFMLEDTRLAFAPREQMPPCDAPGFDHQEVHEVLFNGGKTSKAIFCNKADCLACQIETTPSSLFWQSSN